MAILWTSGLLCFCGFFIFFIILKPISMQETYNLDISSWFNCTTTENFVSFHPTNATGLEETKISERISSKNDQRLNKYIDNQPLNRYFDKKQINEHNNEQRFKNLYKQPFQIQRLNTHLSDQLVNRDLEEQNLKVRPLENYYGNQKLDEHDKYEELTKHVNNKQLINFSDQKQNRPADDQQLNKKFFDKYSSKHSINQYKNQFKNFEQNLDDKHDFNDYNFKTYLVNKHSDKNFNDENSKNHSIDEKFSKYDAKWESNFHLDDQSLEKYLIEKNHDIYVSNLHTGKKFDLQQDKNDHSNQIKEYFIKYKLGRIDDLQLDRKLKDQSFEQYLVDQQIGKPVDNDLHLDRRLSDENYDKHAVNQNFDEYNKDSSYDDIGLHTDRRIIQNKIINNDTAMLLGKESNMSHLMSFTMSNNWEENIPKLNFPKKVGDEKFRMPTLHLDQGLFIFDFLRMFLIFIQPRNIPLDLLKETLDGQINVSTLIKQSIHVEIAFIATMSIFIVLMFIVPGTELWICCRSNKYNYQRRQNKSKIFLLSIFVIIKGMCAVTMLVSNEEVAEGIARIPNTVEAALQDLKDYHAGTGVQLRKCVTRSLDVATEAILADLDNVDELLGKPVQAVLSSEIGVDIALDTLMDVANASQELVYKTNAVLQRAERANEFGSELSREADEIRRELEKTTRNCASEDRSLCAVLDPSGLHLALRLDRVVRDDRLLKLRAVGRDNLTESGRQARGEYLYIPHYVSRLTLEMRNQIRREINTARAKVSDDARSIEANGSDLSNQLEKIQKLSNQIVPYIRNFEYMRWFVGFGIAMCVLLIWLLLFGAICCRCGSSENKVRATLLWFVLMSCFISIALWLVIIAALAIASHAEMILCRPLDDPEYKTIETILETKIFLGRRLSMPLKEVFEKCKQSDTVYPAFKLDNTQKLEQLTAHWTWLGLSRATSKLKVDLSNLRILSPNLRECLQNLLYASGSNLTEHRIMIQGPILNKDLNALADQVENIALQMTDRRMARNFQSLAAQMRDLLSRRVKPLMKMQDELVYQLASLELHLHPLQRQINQSLTHLLTTQHYIENQGEKIGQLKTKAYIDRFNSFLDQWRNHVLNEISSEVSKCRPLWDILQGMKLLFCSHILGPLNGFWFATLICVLTMLLSTPTAHNLASSYWSEPRKKGSTLLSSRQGSPDTVIMERETWRTPDPPPSIDSW